MTIKQITVRQAHQQQTAGAKYLDVRSIPEFEAGHPAGAFNVPLLHHDEATGQMRPNPEFVAALSGALADKEAPLLFICRSGARSAAAAKAMTAAGYSTCLNVADGFEGPLDAQAKRGTAGGWKAAGLPWRQT